MLLIAYIVIALSLSISHGESSYQFTTDASANEETSYEANIAVFLDQIKSEADSKLNAMKKDVSEQLANSLVVKLVKYIVHQQTELENSIKVLKKIMDQKFNELQETAHRSDEHRNTKYDDMLKTAINNIQEESRKLIQNEIKDIRTTLIPAKPKVSPGERNFVIVEIDQTATSYNQIVKKKDSVDVSVTWSTKCGVLADKSKVILNGAEVWYGAGDATSASFKIRKGGRYQMTVDLCNKNGCSSSDATEIIVADTDGSHLSPLKYPIEKNNEAVNQTSGKVVGAYFLEWTVFSKNFSVDRVPFSKLTHLMYSLIPICGGVGINNSLKKNTYDGLQRSCSGREDFKVSIQNPRAALFMTSNSLSNEPYKGHFGKLMMLKQAKPDLKILMSVGGHTFSDPFFLLADKRKRDTFVASVKDFLQTWKFFDGVDIMWMFPELSRDEKTYVQIMKELREMLNELSVETSKKYELTAAISAKWDKIQIVDHSEAQIYMDHMFLLSYGLRESDDNNTLTHYASLYAPTWNPQLTYTADYATKWLLAQGVKPEKIVLGIHMYGLGWTGVHNYENDDPFTGKATGLINGTWEKGWVSYSDISNNIVQGNWEYHYDSVAEAPYVFKKETGDLISYEDTRSTIAKAKYVTNNQLGGLFARGIDGDNGDIIFAMNIGLGKSIN